MYTANLGIKLGIKLTVSSIGKKTTFVHPGEKIGSGGVESKGTEPKKIGQEKVAIA